MTGILQDIWIVVIFAAGYFLGTYVGRRAYFLRGLPLRYIVLTIIVLGVAVTLVLVNLLQIEFLYVAWVPALFAGLLRQSVKTAQS